MAYSNKKHIQQLVYLLKAHDFTDMVLCPGSRNMPIVESLCCGDFKTHRALDERSAGFIALGIAQKRDAKVAVCVTSGSAVANLLPALLEAKYQEIPLVVITADRPKEMINQLLGQTIEQVASLSSAVKYSADIADDESEDGMWYANREINAALNTAFYYNYGPVQINMQIKEPFFDCTTETLPGFRKITLIKEDTYVIGDSVISLYDNAERPLVIYGQRNPDEEQHLWYFSEFEVPVYWEVLANLDERRYEFRLSEDEVERYKPDFVLYIGGHIVSKKVKSAIEKCKPNCMVRVARKLDFADTFKCMTHLFVEHEFYEDIEPYMEDAKSFKTRKRREFNPALYPSVYADFLRRIVNEESHIFLANSTTVRAIDYAYWFMPELWKLSPKFYCNRGVNGIEGTMSAAIGLAMSIYPEPVYLVIGDLSFFYDVSSLWSISEKTSIKILLVNDGGGSIFSRLSMSQTDVVKEFVSERHSNNAEGICASYGIDYRSANSNISDELWNWYFDGEGCKVLEVFL